MLEQTYQSLDIRPGPSSQTTSCWPLSVRVGDEQILSDSVSLHSDNFIIQPQREKTVDEMIEEILQDHAEAWKRLAAL
jgi:hypothetical protein